MISNDNSVIITNNDTPETSPVKNHLHSPDSGSGGTNLSYPALTSPVRKFTTLNRQSHQPKIKPNPVLRTRSFQVPQPKLSQFSPSENSAFHCISANSRDLSQFQAAKFVTSTPVKSVTGRETGRDNGVRQTRRSQHMKNVFTPPAAPLSTFSP